MCYMIMEMEVYCGEVDLVCYVWVGWMVWIEVMYCVGGVWYVYLCYGIYEMFNFVMGLEGFLVVVLIWGVVDVSGSGCLMKWLEIGWVFNGLVVMDVESGLWIEEGECVLREWI